MYFYPKDIYFSTMIFLVSSSFYSKLVICYLFLALVSLFLQNEKLDEMSNRDRFQSN